MISLSPVSSFPRQEQENAPNLYLVEGA